MKKTPFLILILIFLIIQKGYSCICWEKIDSKLFKGLIERSDFVFVGEAVRNVGFHNQRNNQLDQEGIGYNVLFKVDSVIKGKLKSQEVITDQDNDGSCAQTFKIGKKYIVFGIDYKKHWRYEETIKEEMEYKKESYEDLTQFDFYTSLRNEYPIINTNYCSSFLKKKHILEFLK